MTSGETVFIPDYIYMDLQSVLSALSAGQHVFLAVLPGCENIQTHVCGYAADYFSGDGVTVLGPNKNQDVKMGFLCQIPSFLRIRPVCILISCLFYPVPGWGRLQVFCRSTLCQDSHSPHPFNNFTFKLLNKLCLPPP